MIVELPLRKELLNHVLKWTIGVSIEPRQGSDLCPSGLGDLLRPPPGDSDHQLHRVHTPSTEGSIRDRAKDIAYIQCCRMQSLYNLARHGGDHLQGDPWRGALEMHYNSSNT